MKFSASYRFFFFSDTLNHNCIACSQIALHPLLHRRRRSQWRAERNGVWGIEGNCAVPLDEKVRLQCSAVRDPLMWNPDPHLNMLTRWQQSLCEGAEQRAIHAEASGDTHPSVTRWIIEDTPPLPCFLHGLELAGCCIVKRPLEWRPRLWVDSSFFYLSIQLWELSLDTVLPPCRQLSKWFSCALSCFFSWSFGATFKFTGENICNSWKFGEIITIQI